MPYPLFILGAGGFAREVFTILDETGCSHEVAGFVEDSVSEKRNSVLDLPIRQTCDFQGDEIPAIRVACAIGTPLRKGLVRRFEEMSLEVSPQTIIHPSAIFSRWVTWGDGLILCAGSILTSQVTLGKYVIVNLSATIGHDVRIGDFTTISPGAHISGRVVIGEEVFIGTGAAVLENVSIGERSLIGAGSVVTKDVPPDSLAYGTPAKVVRTIDINDWGTLV